MYKDISGRTRKTIRRTPYRAIPMAQRLAHCAAIGKMQQRFEANLRISFIGTGSWEPFEHGESTVEKDWYIACIPKSMYLGCALTTEAASGRSIMSSLSSASLIYSLCESKGAPLAHHIMTKDKSSSKAGASVLKSISCVLHTLLWP